MSESTPQKEFEATSLHRRASVRYRCDRHPTRRVFLVESYQALAAEIHDLSLGGIALICERSVPLDTILYIDLATMDFPTEHLARIVHATHRDDGRWILGCQFTHALTPHELSLALAR